MERPTGPANLPHDVWTLIAARTAAQSVRDLCSLRMSCTAARNAGEEDFVKPMCRFTGIEMMHVVAAHGHSVARFTVSMMLMLRDDAEAKNKGLERFRGLKAAGALTTCKLVFRGIIQGIWIHLRRVPMLNAENLVCSSHACPSRGNMGAIYHH
ncbi:hypothetical protein Ahy_B10g105801 [Arachis hypogaea]|uniref:At2g35280-like TPR domain-containing protein n=1 Tax=Arachis hypogaea TaxID=3818 RepID=A0A444X8Y0_ARAHY|nr:hypothetical protein Ahy_B10g105801 [Arachis hypogaea]